MVAPAGGHWPANAKRSEASGFHSQNGCGVSGSNVRVKVCPLDVRIKVCTSWANFDPDTGYLDIWTYLVCTFRFVPPPPRFVTIDAAAFEVDKIRPDPIRAASCSHASECRLISR